MKFITKIFLWSCMVSTLSATKNYFSDFSPATKMGIGTFGICSGAYGFSRIAQAIISNNLDKAKTQQPLSCLKHMLETQASIKIRNIRTASWIVAWFIAGATSISGFYHSKTK